MDKNLTGSCFSEFFSGLSKKHGIVRMKKQKPQPMPLDLWAQWHWLSSQACQWHLCQWHWRKRITLHLEWSPLKRGLNQLHCGAWEFLYSGQSKHLSPRENVCKEKTTVAGTVAASTGAFLTLTAVSHPLTNDCSPQ